MSQPGRYKDYLASPAPKIPKRSVARYRQRTLSVQTVDNHDDVGSVPLYNIEQINEKLNRDAEATSAYVDDEIENPIDENNFDTYSYEQQTEPDDDFSEISLILNNILLNQADAYLNEEEELFDSHELNIESNFENTGDEPLFPGSRMKVQELVLLLLTLSSSCHIAGTTLKFIMKIIELVCPTQNKCKTSMRSIHQFLQSLDLPIGHHYYCEKCFMYKGTEKKVEICCCGERATGYFIDIPMLGELKKILERLWKYTGYRFARNTEGTGVQDVYDGRMYQKHFKDSEDILRDPNNISLIGFVDGVSIFKSSGFSVWPVYLAINELPPNLRFRRENGIFAGLWFGKTKPQFTTFFKPFAETIWDMCENGMEVSTDNGVIKVRVFLLQMTCDAPAKCLFQNFKQFNGKYGCPYCLHPGESVLHGGRSRSYVYDYRKEDECGKRNHSDTLKHGNEAYQNKLQGKSKFDVFGVKGLSWGMFLPHFDIIESVCIDYMHAVLLGVMKQLMTLWFGSSHKAATWSCYGNIKTVQDRLLNIKPTNSITRVPRSLEELNHWKASEFRAWILFYGHVCLYEILADEYYQHFLLLAEAVWYLLQEDISDAEIEQADRNLQYFCFQIEHLYDSVLA